MINLEGSVVAEASTVGIISGSSADHDEIELGPRSDGYAILARSQARKEVRSA
jgi:hypothetical protein